MSGRRTCTAHQVNARAPDFTCKMDAGHGSAHEDPRTGTRWGESKFPVGVRKPRGA